MMTHLRDGPGQQNTQGRNWCGDGVKIRPLQIQLPPITAVVSIPTIDAWIKSDGGAIDAARRAPTSQGDNAV